MKTKAVLWDVGGTLVTDGNSQVLSVRRRLVRAEVGHSSISDEYIVSTFEHFYRDERTWRTLEDERRARESWAEKLLAPCELSEQRVKACGPALDEYYDVHEPVEGIFEFVEELRGRGLKQAIVSNWPPSLPLFLEHHGLAGCFWPVVFSAEDGIHKPDERIFHRALKSLEVEPTEVIFVGDTPDCDIVPTRAMGMRAIHFDPRRKHPGREAEDVSALRRILLSML